LLAFADYVVTVKVDSLPAGQAGGDYTLTLTLDTDESYTYAKLGYDTTTVEAAS
jgi:hypothetical protein